ncbi:MAG: AAA family ATPase [Spirochaetia bacterium]|nr:AAA family ATPase [Spirochaetia bacterium]
MAEATQNQDGSQEFSLPIDIMTLLKALLRKKWWILLCILLAGALGVGAALQLGTQSFEAVTVLYYQPVTSSLSDQFMVSQSTGAGTSLSYQQGSQLTKREDSTISLSTLVNMVEITPNFERLRTELDLPMTFEQLGSSISVSTARNTNLMLIKASSSDREKAALIANKIRDVFLDSIQTITMGELREQMNNLDVQLAVVGQEIEMSTTEFREFLQLYDLEDVDLENTPYAQQLLSASMELEKNTSLVRVYTMEIEKINQIIADTNKLMANESESTGNSLTQDDVVVQIKVLQDQIGELRTSEVNSLMIQQEEDLYRIAQEEYANGVIGRAELTTAQYRYEIAVAQYAGTTDIDFIRNQIELLRNTDVVGYGESLSYATYLKDLRLKRVDAELRLLAANEAYETSMRLVTSLEQALEGYPEKLQQYTTLKGKIASLRAEQRGLEKMQAQTKIALDQGYSDFMIISDALPPVYPVGSNKKIIAIAVAFLVFTTGFLIIFLLVFFEKRLRSPGEAAIKIRQRITTVLPAYRRRDEVFPGEQRESIFIEQFRQLARTVRSKYHEPGAAFLIASTVSGEEKTLVTINLAAVLGRQDERVLILDGQVRKTTADTKYSEIMFPEDVSDERFGLGEYLSYMASDLDEIVYHTVLSGVDLIPIKHDAIIPDLLQSARMRELVEELKSHYSVILIEAPPVESSVDAEILAQYCDAVVYVVAGKGAAASRIRASIKRIKTTSADLCAVVLTGIQKDFL